MRRAPPPLRSSSSSSSSATSLVISPTLLFRGLSSCSPDPRTLPLPCFYLFIKPLIYFLWHISSSSSQCKFRSSLCFGTLSWKPTYNWTYFSFSVDLLPAYTPSCPSLPCHWLISLPISALFISAFFIFLCRFPSVFIYLEVVICVSDHCHWFEIWNVFHWRGYLFIPHVSFYRSLISLSLPLCQSMWYLWCWDTCQLLNHLCI